MSIGDSKKDKILLAALASNGCSLLKRAKCT